MPGRQESPSCVSFALRQYTSYSKDFLQFALLDFILVEWCWGRLQHSMIHRCCWGYPKRYQKDAEAQDYGWWNYINSTVCDSLTRHLFWDNYQKRFDRQFHPSSCYQADALVEQRCYYYYYLQTWYLDMGQETRFLEMNVCQPWWEIM